MQGIDDLRSPSEAEEDDDIFHIQDKKNFFTV